MSSELYIVLELHKFAQKSTAIFLTQLKMQSEKASDVTLVLKDGKEIRVNGNELSAASDFFFTLQNTDMKERREGIIRLQHISENVMRDVLEFSRSGTVLITYKNAQHALDLFEAADYFLSRLEKGGCGILKTDITTFKLHFNLLFCEKISMQGSDTSCGHRKRVYLCKLCRCG